MVCWGPDGWFTHVGRKKGWVSIVDTALELRYSATKVQAYHDKFYVPHNLCVIVFGKFTGGTESLLSAIQQNIEPALIEHGYSGGHQPSSWKRSTLEVPSHDSKSSKSRSISVPIPRTKWTRGCILMVFMGPAAENLLHQEVCPCVACELLRVAILLNIYRLFESCLSTSQDNLAALISEGELSTHKITCLYLRTR